MPGTGASTDHGRRIAPEVLAPDGILWICCTRVACRQVELAARVDGRSRPCADRALPKRLAIVVGLSSNKLLGCRSFFYPTFERRQQVDAGVRDTGPVGEDATMIHSRNHEQACEIPRLLEAAGVSCNG